MSTFAPIAATAALGFLLGWLARRPQLTAVRRRLSAANHHALHDRLTGLPNRDHAIRVFHHRQQRGEHILIALLDLDHFKNINDRYGHRAGDALLRLVAHRLAVVSGRHAGNAARLSGDEFLLILPALPDPRLRPERLVEETLAFLARPTTLRTEHGPVDLRPRASAGIAVLDHAGVTTFATLLHHADIALYHAKQHPGSYRLYHQRMRMPDPGARSARVRDQRPGNGNGPQDGGPQDGGQRDSGEQDGGEQRASEATR